jgi:hypothetical protein
MSHTFFHLRQSRVISGFFSSSFFLNLYLYLEINYSIYLYLKLYILYLNAITYKKTTTLIFVTYLNHIPTTV